MFSTRFLTLVIQGKVLSMPKRYYTMPVKFTYTRSSLTQRLQALHCAGYTPVATTNVAFAHYIQLPFVWVNL